MMRKILLSLVLALPLGGCLGLGGPPPPPTLFTLSAPPAAPAPRVAGAGQTVTVAVPEVPLALRTLRLPVRVSQTEIAYLKDAQWVEQPNRLFQRVVADMIETRTGLTVLGPNQTRLDPGRQVTGDLLDFGLDASDPGQSVVRIRYDATMAAAGGTGIVTRRFEAAQPVAGSNPKQVAVALNAVAQTVAADVADWIGGSR